MSLLVVSTHPIQYQAPVYRAVQQQFNIPTTVIYGSDFSVSGYQDHEFGTNFSWDTDLLSGYTTIFLSRVADGGASSYDAVTTTGLSQLLRKLEFKAALVLGYYPRFHFDAFWTLRRAHFDVPLLLRAEASDRSLQRSKAKQLVRDTLLSTFYKQFARILYIGEESRSHYRRLGYPEAKLIFSPYCVDTTPFSIERDANRKSIRQQLGVRDDQIVLLFSGKLVARKAPATLMSALEMLPEEQRNHLFILFLGDGEQRPELEQMSTSLNVHFVGFKNQRELSPYYHAADALALPSISGETWGLVVNEALYHGLPCIVSDRVGCTPDLIKPGITGEIFRAESASSLADAIQRCVLLLDKPDTSAKCQALVSKYSIEAAARGIAQAYAEVTDTA